mmetsp:Transcript_4412/g.14268  ORF Transcript_4412/g.14268 Transcript_4412/m.14268 type:complete len:171 (-) Transcript_4412:192-704(-)
MHMLGRACRHLVEINVGWLDRLTDGGLEALFAGCSGLHTVDLCGCVAVGDGAVVAAARACPSLRKLGLHCVRRLTDTSMLALAGAGSGSLSSLNVSGCRRIGVAALQAVCDAHPGLHTCAALRSINVSGCLALVGVTCGCAAKRDEARRDRWAEGHGAVWVPLDFRHRVI